MPHSRLIWERSHGQSRLGDWAIGRLGDWNEGDHIWSLTRASERSPSMTQRYEIGWVRFACFLLLIEVSEDTGHRFGERIGFRLFGLAALAGGGDGGAGEAGDTEREAAGIAFLGKQAGEGVADGAELVVQMLLFGGLGEDAGEGRIKEVPVCALGQSAPELLGGIAVLSLGDGLVGVLCRSADGAVPVASGAALTVGPADRGSGERAAVAGRDDAPAISGQWFVLLSCLCASLPLPRRLRRSGITAVAREWRSDRCRTGVTAYAQSWAPR
jgi:hypothetical protein